MGHIESDGEVAEPKPAPRRRLTTIWREGEETHPAWTVWWRLKRNFSLAKAPASWFGTPGSWTYFGNDFLTGLRRNESTRLSFELLDERPELFEALRDLAALNLKRHEQMFQFIALLYVTVPVTVILGLAEVMPDDLVRLFAQQQLAVLILVGAMTFGALVYLVGMWRARQLLAVMELWRIERTPCAASALKARQKP